MYRTHCCTHLWLSCLQRVLQWVTMVEMDCKLLMLESYGLYKSDSAGIPSRYHTRIRSWFLTFVEILLVTTSFCFRPFFWTTIPGAVRTEDNKAGYQNIAKQVCDHVESIWLFRIWLLVFWHQDEISTGDDFVIDHNWIFLLFWCTLLPILCVSPYSPQI